MRRNAIPFLIVHALLAAILMAGVPFRVAAAAPPAVRQLAPGVLTTVPPSLEPSDTVSTHSVMELQADPGLKWKPEYFSADETLVGMAGQVKFRREIHCLEFSFKPFRMIEVELPNDAGKSEKKLVWYLVYRVTNTGNTLKPVEGADGVYSTTAGKGGEVRFIPQFVLESQDRHADGNRVMKSYLDRVIPGAVAAIAERERLVGKLLNSVEIAEQPIPVGDGRIQRGVWGVATWVDVDPRLDFFSVLVGGLTNAYRWTDNPAAYKPGDTPGRGRRFAHKMLQLNFWRPGDELHPNEREFRLGVPLGKNKAELYEVGEGVAYRWVYR
ncbi:MAG: hypothetical protein IT425_14615 [Pirellulales bacterium]|nr:hypothetical protein [Pirellulales bacterium]